MKTQNINVLFLFLVVALLPCVSVLAQTQMITNGDFESNLRGWTTAQWGTNGSIRSTRDRTVAGRISGASSARIDIGRDGDPETSEWWELAFTQEFSIHSDRFYSGTFKVRASEPVLVQVQMQQISEPYTAVAHNTFMVGENIQKVRLSGVSTYTGDGAIRFFFGKTKRGAKIWIDEVSVTESQAQGTTAEVTVDFATPESAKDLSGLLLGLGYWYGTSVAEPAESLIDPLRLKHWRVPADHEYIDRVLSLGAMPIVIRDMRWWADSTPGNTNTPWADDWAQLDSEIDALVTRYGNRIIYEVWNEPDLPESFANYVGGTFEKYLEMFKRVHNRIRAIAPDAYIIGPSMSASFDWFRLHQFMQFCVDNGLTVQGLSLHMWDADPALESMREDLLRARRELIENPAYARVGMSELLVIEYAYAEMRQRPGSNLAMVRLMEKGRVDGATSSCWTHLADCTDRSSCFDATLAGLLTCDGTSPRPLWWAQKWYADGAGYRVAASISHRGIVPLASNNDGIAQVILASRGFQGAALNMEMVTLNLNNLIAGGVVLDDGPHTVWVYAAPFGGYEQACEPLLSPVLVTRTELYVTDGHATLILHDGINAYDALLVVFDEPAALEF